MILWAPRYNAAKGLLFSHMGWIFRKPSYKKMSLIERRDLEADPGAFLYDHCISPLLTLLQQLFDFSIGIISRSPCSSASVFRRSSPLCGTTTRSEGTSTAASSPGS